MTTHTEPRTESDVASRLGQPRLELRIEPGDARAYEVKAGEYVQIIDLEGQQCTDFLAFDGVNHADEMNLTLTRNNCEALWPAPGQCVYADSGAALLRIEADLVNRHDTTLPACNADYYAALGYPDHKNCTDNFNRELGAHGLTPRHIWEPINFFYNTSLGEDRRSIVVDVSTSTPGDYVLMRAERDLLLASSACPDDIGPTNGWHPSDVLVRVFSAPHE